jgi:2',3'-cyclic-nucleotide 2'-phosphodiesterase/3'-nucleotidase
VSFSRGKFHRAFGSAALVLCTVLLLTAQSSPQRVAITLLATTDLHGNLMPVDYYANRPAERGLAKIATLIRKVRAEQSHVLLVDCGDTIQGTPLAYYFARKDTSLPNPTITAMNALGYDAMAVGNHEFNFGLPALYKAKREANFPWLAANIRQRYTSGVEYFPPYVVRTIGGVRVGVVGFITPGVPRWEIPEHYRGYQFEQIVESAKRLVPTVRKQVDLLVVIAHSGLERDPQSGEAPADQIPGENAMWALAEQVPGIDVILYGHSHREMPQLLVNGVLLAQARNWGQSLARADVEMERDASGRWRVTNKRSTVLPVTPEVAPDPEISILAEPYHQATQKYLDTPIATSAVDMDGSSARYEDHPLVDLIHTVQMNYGRADVSLATMLFAGARVPRGDVTIRQLASVYIYENTLYTVEMSGAQLRQVLEHAASFYPAWPFRPGERIRLPGYNADCAEGIDYEIDLAKPAGQRILNLKYQGQPLADGAKLRVATNNYRYAGGGNYKVLRGLPIVYRSPQEIRELLIEYVSRARTVPTSANGNWRIVPREAVDAILEQVRQREPVSAAAP